METFLAALFSGTSRGAVFALVALGLVIVWRGAVHKEHRAQLLEACALLPFCDIAASGTSIDRCKHLVRNWLTPQQQMTYKYLFIIEGNDIASNILSKFSASRDISFKLS